MWKQLQKLLGRDAPRKKSDLLILLLAGVLLLSCGSLFAGKKKAETPPAEAAETAVFSAPSREEALEERLAAILTQVAGAGTVQVMLTLENDGVQEVARDERTENTVTTEGGEGGSTRESRESVVESTVVLWEDGSGGSRPLVLSSGTAEVTGAVVVAQGGGDIVVREALSRAVQALLNVPAHKVEVLKMKE